MKLILTQPVSGLGNAGDVVDVKDGYARNFLLPRKVATAWTKGGQKQVDSIRTARSKREIADVETARSVKASLEAKPVTLKVNAGATGRLFGAVTTGDVADAVQAALRAGAPSRPPRRRRRVPPLTAPLCSDLAGAGFLALAAGRWSTWRSR